MKLYYVPQTRSGRPRWLLEEIGAPYEIVRLDVAARENRKAEYLALNPLGHVPTLVDGAVVIYETLAIGLYLADRFPDKRLAPAPDSPQRGLYLQWMAFSVVTVERVVEQLDDHVRRLPEADRQPRLADAARARFAELAQVVDGALGDREFLVGSDFSAADVMMASTLGWARRFGLLEGFPSLEAYAHRAVSRPAAKRARAD
jgi:glutathione S-transferase